jgi:membrane complex biogenesis BtpA family protein
MTTPTGLNRLIGMIQFPGFPHDPGGMASVAAVVDRCTRDADVLQEAGFRTLMVQNLATCSPWRHETTAETASVAALLGRLVLRFPEPVWGLNLPSDDPEASLAIAYASGAAFVRLKVWIGVMRRAEGTLDGCAAAALSYRHRLGDPPIEIWTDVHDRTGAPVWPVAFGDAVAAASKAGARTIVVTGGNPTATIARLAETRRRAPSVRRIVGGGATPQTLAGLIDDADGVIIGTYLHEDGDESRPLDPVRVRRIMAAVPADA